MENIIPTAGVLIYNDKKDEVLLVMHKNGASNLTGVCGFPAGRLNKGESKIEAALRELEEETGFKSSKKHLIKLPKLYVSDILRKTGVGTFSIEMYLCKNYGGELKENDETRPFWARINELDNYNLLPNIKEIVRDGLQV